MIYRRTRNQWPLPLKHHLIQHLLLINLLLLIQLNLLHLAHVTKHEVLLRILRKGRKLLPNGAQITN